MAQSAPRRSRREAATRTLRTAGRFLYSQVAEELRRRIVQGVYGPGSRIPSEADLVREFRVSAITVRRTVRDLQFEGLLVGRQGLVRVVEQRGGLDQAAVHRDPAAVDASRGSSPSSCMAPDSIKATGSRPRPAGRGAAGARPR